MFIFDISSPITVLLLLAGTVLAIFLGRETKQPYGPAAMLILFLIFIVIHAVQFGILPEENYEVNRALIARCVGIDCVFIFLSFISYLWIDDISSKFYKKKSIDNSLDWFWDKI